MPPLFKRIPQSLVPDFDDIFRLNQNVGHSRSFGHKKEASKGLTRHKYYMFPDTYDSCSAMSSRDPLRGRMPCVLPISVFILESQATANCWIGFFVLFCFVLF
jgi:hypothetical protein